MNTKTMKILGILFLVVGSISIVGSIVLWFVNYYVMANGYYYGDAIMISFTVLLYVGFLVFPAIPLLIVSNVRKNREINKTVSNHIKEEAVRFCVYCGTKHVVNANYCIKCGRALK